MLLSLVVITAAGLAAVVVTLYWTPAPRIRNYIQHFTAGLVLAVVALEVMPDIAGKQTRPLLTLAGFAVGGLVLLLVKWGTEADQGGSYSQGTLRGLVAATALDNVVDGATIGAGFASGTHLGRVLALTLGLEVIFLAFSIGGAMRSHRLSRLMTAGVNGGLVLIVGCGAATGFFALHGASPQAIACVLAFGAAALVYLVTEELLVEAHRSAELVSAAGLLFLGFLLIFAFHLLTGDRGA